MIQVFHQVVGDGGNLFVLIIALLFGFVNALAFIDHSKVTKEQEEQNKH